ncbi:MAG: hypothetical protein K8M05_26870, partial [Deltaproteobacteria bacterium]|nr:hypothetical protein [Kofleriaceae bacterium]
PVVHRREPQVRARGRFPLTERAYLGLAAMHHGSPVDVDPRVDAYARGVELAVTGRPCAQLQHLLSQALPARGTSRRATVTIELSHCEDESRWTTSEEMAEWRERVAPFVKRRTVKVTECSRSATPVYACSGTPMTCSHAGTALGRTNCTTFDRVVEDPVYNFERRRDLRPFRVLSGRYYVAGRWRVTRDGREWTDTFQFETPLSGRTSEAWKDSPPIREVPAGDFQTPAAAPIVAAVRAVLDESFADDIARAVEAARAREAAGQVDEADEAWIQVALLGGEPGGRFAQLGVTAADLRAAFLAVNPERWQLASARTFHLPRRPPKYTERNLMNLQAALVPIGKHVWFEGGGGNIALPAIQPMGEPAPLGGLSAMTLDLRFGGSFVGQKRKSAYGLRLHDDASVAFGAGMVYDKPEDAVGSSGFHASAGYALGVGYRHPAIGGLAIGARPELGYVKVGLNGGAHTSVPAFGRLELAIGLRSLTLEAYAPLVGDARTGGAVHLAWVRKQREGEKLRLTRFISVRYDRRELDVTLDVPTDIERDVTVEDHEISTASASFGLGF